jgi:hypothetical protein
VFGQAVVTGPAVLPAGVLRRPLPPFQCSSLTRPGAESERASKQEREGAMRGGQASKREGAGRPSQSQLCLHFYRHCLLERKRGA